MSMNVSIILFCSYMNSGIKVVWLLPEFNLLFVNSEAFYLVGAFTKVFSSMDTLVSYMMSANSDTFPPADVI